MSDVPSKTAFQRLIENENLYPKDFVTHFGIQGPHWERALWVQREASLRHDMICALLCNLEPMDLASTPVPVLSGDPVAYRRRRNPDPSGPSSSTSSSSYDLGQMEEEVEVETAEETLKNPDANYRYVLMEGRPSAIVIQNSMCEAFGVPTLRHTYDIVDLQDKKFIEVKCTYDMNAPLFFWNNSGDPQAHIRVIHIHPKTLKVTRYGFEGTKMPGETKAANFLVSRRACIAGFENIQEMELDFHENLSQEVFCCHPFNEMVSEWEKSFWDHREIPPPENIDSHNTEHKLSKIIEPQLKHAIEDTTKRNAEFMQTKFKILPESFITSVEMDEYTDSNMITTLFQDLEFMGNNDAAVTGNYLVKRWQKSDFNTFTFIKQNTVKNIPKKIQEALGVGMKATLRYDHYQKLVQEEFTVPPKLRYSAWLSHVMKDLSTTTEQNYETFPLLTETEVASQHPIAAISQDAVSLFYKHFGRTKAALYASRIKNFYSRLGGAYVNPTDNKSKSANIVIFPIYATTTREGKTRRLVSGFIVRGPHTAKQPTDRVNYIIFEMIGITPLAIKLKPFIKKATFLTDKKGNIWCYRQNAIMKSDSPHLAFVNNSTFLAINMFGEWILNDPANSNDVDLAVKVQSSMTNNSGWYMERVVESVMMAVSGGSQEEGALSIIRKIFMIKMAWVRAEAVYCWNPIGLADKLNECLMDAPLALYFAKQMRDFLNG